MADWLPWCDNYVTITQLQDHVKWVKWALVTLMVVLWVVYLTFSILLCIHFGLENGMLPGDQFAACRHLGPREACFQNDTIALFLFCPKVICTLVERSGTIIALTFQEFVVLY